MKGSELLFENSSRLWRSDAPPVVYLLIFAAVALPVLVDTELAFVSAQAPFVLWLGARSYRSLLGTVWIGANLTWLGSVGAVSYLGISTLSAQTLTTATLFSITLSLVIYIVGFGSKSESPSGVRIPSGPHTLLLLLACSLLALRFTSGVPILQGNAARLEGVISVSPLLGLASGSVAIAAAFMSSSPTRWNTILRFVLLALAFGTASRLLLLVVAVGLVSSSSLVRGRSWTFRSGSVGLAAGLLAIWALTKVYELRTEQSSQASDAAKTENVGGVAQFINDQLGASLFLSARNGLAVAELVERRDLQPPHGFIVGGFMNSVRIAPEGGDPERWLTTALGFDVQSVGAIATPIWAGASSNFGQLGMILFAVGLGLAVCAVVERIPGVSVWLSISLLLSYYGSYLVSAQFIASSLLILVMFRMFGIRKASPPVDDRPERNQLDARAGILKR